MFSLQVDQHIKLKLLEARYAQMIFGEIEANRTYLAEFLPWVDSTTHKNDVKTYIDFELKRLSENNGFACGIFYLDKYVGNISLHDIDWKAGKSSIGYWLSEDLQGKGIMTKACKALIDYCFNELELNKIEIRARTDNDKSQAIPKRLGFTQEGTLREVEYNKARYHDHVVFGILKSEWNRLKRGSSS